MTKLEMTPDADLAYYIRKTGDSPIIVSKFTYVKADPKLSAMEFVAPESKEEHAPAIAAKSHL